MVILRTLLSQPQFFKLTNNHSIHVELRLDTQVEPANGRSSEVFNEDQIARDVIHQSVKERPAGKRIYLAFQGHEALTTSVGLLQSAGRRLLPTDNLA